jgi:hypothetical protein
MFHRLDKLLDIIGRVNAGRPRLGLADKRQLELRNLVLQML